MPAIRRLSIASHLWSTTGFDGSPRTMSVENARGRHCSARHWCTRPTCVSSRARDIDWQDRGHFFAIAAQVMRRILVDAARARGAEKRGGQLERAIPASAADFDTIAAPGSDRALALCALDDALTSLARLDPRRAQVIELRFFGGLTVEETAEVLQVSAQTVMRDWKTARTWLARELRRA